MYSTALQLLTHISGLEFLDVVGPASAWIAFVAWALVALGWLASIVGGIRKAIRGAPPPIGFSVPEVAPVSETPTAS